MYRGRITGDEDSLNQATVNCTIQCSYIQSVILQFSSYTIYLASVNGLGDTGPENNMTILGYGSTTSSGNSTVNIRLSFFT